MSERLLVYRVRTWRHVCWLPTLEEALAHARSDLDRAHPGQIEISRHRVSQAFWNSLDDDCDHPSDAEGEAALPESEALEADDAPLLLTNEQVRRLGGRP